MSDKKPLILFHSDKSVSLPKTQYSDLEVLQIVKIFFAAEAVDWVKLENYLKPKGSIH